MTTQMTAAKVTEGPEKTKESRNSAICCIKQLGVLLLVVVLIHCGLPSGIWPGNVVSNISNKRSRVLPHLQIPKR